MSRNGFYKALCTIASLWIVLGSIGIGTADSSKLSGKEVKIGVLLPKSGPVAALGIQQEIAMNIALEEINSAGGVGGIPLRLIVYDTAGDKNQAISTMQKLINLDKVLAIMGPFLSGECEVTFPIANRERIVASSASSATPGISARNRPWAFRNSTTTDKVYGPVMEKWAREKNVKKVALIFDNKDTMMKTDGTVIFPAVLKQKGIELLDSVPYMTEDIDFSAQVTRIKNSNPDGIVIAGFYNHAGNILREIRKQGMNQPIFGGIDTGQAKFIEMATPKLAEGVYAATNFWADAPDPKVQQFVTKFKKAYGGKDPHLTAPQMYDNIYISKAIIEEMGVTNKPEDLESDRDKIRQGWAKLKDFPGVMGKTSIDANGDGLKETYALIVKDGKWVRSD